MEVLDQQIFSSYRQTVIHCFLLRNSTLKKLEARLDEGALFGIRYDEVTVIPSGPANLGVTDGFKIAHSSPRCWLEIEIHCTLDPSPFVVCSDLE